MIQQSLITSNLQYGHKILQAGIHGLHAGQETTMTPEILVAARASLKVAAVGAGLAWLGCNLLRSRTSRTNTMIACSALAFCAEFGWKTRSLQYQLFESASTEISKVRDQRWLEMNPIDYA